MTAPSPEPVSSPDAGAREALVMDTELRPLAGIRLRFRHPLQPVVERVSDAAGRVGLDGLSPDLPYRVELEGEGVVPRRRHLLLPAERADLRLRFLLERSLASLSAEIRDATGRPVAGAVLRSQDQSFETGADGRVSRALARPAGPVRVHRQGYAPCVLSNGACRLTPASLPLRLRLAESHRPLGLSASEFRAQITGLLAETRAAGYEIGAWPAGDALDPGRDLLWLASPATPLSERELTALRDFAEAGGKVLISSEWAGFGPQADDSLRSLLAEAGLAPGGDSLNQGRQLGVSLFEAHRLLTGLRSLALYRSASLRSLDPDRASLLAYSPADGYRIASARNQGGQAVLACALLGLGKLVAIGDSSLWLESDADGDGVTNFREADNARLWQNILQW